METGQVKNKKRSKREPQKFEVVVNFVTSPEEASIRLTKALYKVYIQQEEEKLKKQIDDAEIEIKD